MASFYLYPGKRNPILAFFISGVLAPISKGPDKLSSYESGIEPMDNAWLQFRICYYMFTLVFVFFFLSDPNIQSGLKVSVVGRCSFKKTTQCISNGFSEPLPRAIILLILEARLMGRYSISTCDLIHATPYCLQTEVTSEPLGHPH